VVPDLDGNPPTQTTNPDHWSILGLDESTVEIRPAESTLNETHGFFLTNLQSMGVNAAHVNWLADTKMGWPVFSEPILKYQIRLYKWQSMGKST